MNIQLVLPYEALFVLWKLQQAGFEGYLVGGAVRDLVIQSLQAIQDQVSPLKNYHEVSDYDFATNATPQQIQELFPESYYTNEFGMVGIAYKHLNALLVASGFSLPRDNIASRAAKQAPQSSNKIIDIASASKIHTSLVEQVKSAKDRLSQSQQTKIPPVEITTYRSEGLYSDFRHPDEISWGDSISQDLERRDFSINAIALSVKQAQLNKLLNKNHPLPSLLLLESDQFELVDEHRGLKDLASQLICTVRNPDERFQEDALRMLRAIRFACQLKFKIEPLTFASIKTHADLIQKISWERIQLELLKMIASEQPARGFRLLDETGLLEFIMPELLKMKGVEQGGHHDTDVWTHSLDALDSCPSPDAIVRLAALLHDIGKPSTYQVRNGEITFYNHEIISSRIADNIAKRLKFSNPQREKLFKLVRYHMFHYQPHHTDSAIRRIIKRVGLEYIDDILDLREGDRLGSGARRTSWRLEELKQRIIEQLNQPMDYTDLAIDGHDLMQELNLKPGRIIGDLQKHLLELVLEEPELNTKENLLNEAKMFVKENYS